MNVWVVMESIYYEDSFVSGVFSTEQAARERVERLRADRKRVSDYVSVDRWLVDGAETYPIERDV